MQRKGDMDAGAGTDPSQMRLQIYPRRKAGQKHKDSRTGAAVVVTLDVLHGFADIPLVHAAKKLGISKTALKSACRTLGLERWPFRRPPEEPKPTPKAESIGKKRAASGGLRGAGAGVGACSGKGRGRKRQKVSVQKASGGQGGAKNRAEVKDEVEDEEEQFSEGCPREEDADSGFEDVDSSHDFEEHMSADQGEDDFDDPHGVELVEIVPDERQQRDEDWGSGTEGGETGTSSSHGAQGTSEKTSGDESGGRSSGDEGGGAAGGASAHEPLNDLSWMTHGDAALEAFSHSLDDVCLHPIVIHPEAHHPAQGESMRSAGFYAQQVRKSVKNCMKIERMCSNFHSTLCAAAVHLAFQQPRALLSQRRDVALHLAGLPSPPLGHLHMGR